MRIGLVVENYLKSHNISMREFAIKSGLSHGYLSNLIKGYRNDRPDVEISPSLDVLYKIANTMGITLNQLCEMVDADAVVVLRPEDKMIPILGTVRAGVPYDAEENVTGYVQIDSQLQGNYFALKLKGDSMSPRMCEGDLVIVKEQSYVESGEIAIVLVNGNEATCKRVLIGKDGITLVGLNPNFVPINYSKSDVISKPVQIIGKVVECRIKL